MGTNNGRNEGMGAGLKVKGRNWGHRDRNESIRSEVRL